jgi:hypothetical protein
MKTENKATVAMVITTLVVAFACSLLGWAPRTFLLVGFEAGVYAAALVSWGGNKL